MMEGEKVPGKYMSFFITGNSVLTCSVEESPVTIIFIKRYRSSSTGECLPFSDRSATGTTLLLVAQKSVCQIQLCSSIVEVCADSCNSFCPSGVLGKDLTHAMARVTAEVGNNSRNCLTVSSSSVFICGTSDTLGFSVTLPPFRSFSNRTVIFLTVRRTLL